MKAAILYDPGSPLQVEDVDIQPPRRGEVLVRVAAAGRLFAAAFIVS